jgi:hypothetical protein
MPFDDASILPARIRLAGDGPTIGRHGYLDSLATLAVDRVSVAAPAEELDLEFDPEPEPVETAPAWLRALLPQSWEILYRTDGGALVEITLVVTTAEDWDRRDEDERADRWVECRIGPLIVAVRMFG